MNYQTTAIQSDAILKFDHCTTESIAAIANQKKEWIIKVQWKIKKKRSRISIRSTIVSRIWDILCLRLLRLCYIFRFLLSPRVQTLGCYSVVTMATFFFRLLSYLTKRGNTLVDEAVGTDRWGLLKSHKLPLLSSASFSWSFVSAHSIPLFALFG